MYKTRRWSTYYRYSQSLGLHQCFIIWNKYWRFREKFSLRPSTLQWTNENKLDSWNDYIYELLRNSPSNSHSPSIETSVWKFVIHHQRCQKSSKSKNSKVPLLDSTHLVILKVKIDLVTNNLPRNRQMK